MTNRRSWWRDGAWWLPLAFVVVSLLLLLLVPIMVERRTRQLAHEIDDQNRSRVLVNDLEAAGATQALISARPRGLNVASDSASEPLALSAATGAADDARELDSLLRRDSPEVRADLATIESVESRWRDARPGETARLTASAGAEDDPLRLFSAAERLDSLLARRLDSSRAKARRLQRLNVVSASILTPVALLSVLAVFVAGWRSRLLARRLEREREALAESLESRAALIRGITHDLKNPIGAATGYADLLLEGAGSDPLVPSQAAMVTRIRKLLVESTGTISSLVELARVDAADELRIAAAPVDVVELARECTEDYRAAASERGLTLELQSTAPKTIVVTDGGHVHHILGNLISNAVKYTPPPGRVVVRVAPSGGALARTVRLEVRDSGRGIPPEFRERVFDEFFRMHGQATEADGHGVGLAISRRLARLLGGNLAVSEAPEGGAMFVLELPQKGA